MRSAVEWLATSTSPPAARWRGRLRQFRAEPDRSRRRVSPGRLTRASRFSLGAPLDCYHRIMAKKGRHASGDGQLTAERATRIGRGLALVALAVLLLACQTNGPTTSNGQAAAPDRGPGPS